MWEAKLIKAEDVVFEDRVGQDPVTARYGRIVRQPLSGGLGFGIIECDDMAEDWFQNYDQILYILEGNFPLHHRRQGQRGPRGRHHFHTQRHATALRDHRQSEAALYRLSRWQHAVA